MPRRIHRSAPTYCTDFGSSIRTFGSRSELMTLLSTLRSGLAAPAAKHEVKMSALMISLSSISIPPRIEKHGNLRITFLSAFDAERLLAKAFDVGRWRWALSALPRHVLSLSAYSRFDPAF